MEDSLTTEVPNQLGQSSKGQASQGLIVQGYCHSVLQQPTIDLAGHKNLAKYDENIKKGLGGAKDHAQNYLLNIQPRIITNIASISNYFELHRAVATTLSAGSSKNDWLEGLNALKDQSGQYHSDAKDLAEKLRKLGINISENSGEFSNIVEGLNAAVNGDKGELASIESQLGQMQSKIDGAIAGISLSGFAIMGGIFIIAVGSITNFVTAGTSTPLVVAGVAVLLAGIGGEVGSAITLANLNNEKSTLLQNKAHLASEVKLALGVSSGYNSLNNQAKAAAQAASTMAGAWGNLENDLDTLVKNVEKGATSTGILSKIFLETSNATIQTVRQDTERIKDQMTGVTLHVTKGGQTLNDTLNSLIIQNPEYKKAA